MSSYLKFLMSYIIMSKVKNDLDIIQFPDNTKFQQIKNTAN